MATNKNFIVKNGLEVGGQEVVSSSGVVTSAALGGQTLSSTDSPTFANLTVSNDLAVSGDLNLTGDLNITGNVNTLSVTDLDVTDQTITLGAGQVESASGGSGIIVDGSLASILWDETNDVFDFNKGLTTTGNVGIGTDTPDYDLHIEKSSASANVDLMVRNSGTDGTSNTRIMSYVSSTSGGDPKIGLGVTGVRDYFWRIDNSDSDKLKLDTNGVDILTINDSGDVGIGTDNPTHPLHISHSTDGEGIQIDHTTVGGYNDIIFTTKNNASSQIAMNRIRSNMIDGTTSAEAGQLELWGMNSGTEKLGLRIDRMTSTFINSFTTYGDFSNADTAGSNYHEIGTWTASQSSRITIRINGAPSFSNNTDPAGETVIHGTITNGNDFEGFFYGIGSNSTASAVAVKANGDGTHTIYIIPGQYGSYESHVTITKNDTWTPKTSSHSTGSSSLPTGAVGLQSEFGVNISGTRKLLVNSSGNVGIGTDSISSKLHVDASFDGPLVTIHQTGGASANNRGLDVETSSTGTTVQRWFNSGTELMRVQGDGFVGIGLGGSESNYPLAVRRAGGGGTYGINVDNYGSDPYLNRTILHYAAGDNSGEQSGHIFFTRETGTTDSPRLTINSIGKVGIGTTSPSAPLHVFKTDTYSAIISRQDWNSGTPTKLGLGKEYGVLSYISTDLVETTNDTTYIALNYKSGLSTFTEGLRVYNNGNVGIGPGKTAPSYRVDVNGNVRATAYSSDYIALYNIASGSYTAGTWYDFTDRTTIANYGYGNGMYIFRIYDDTFGAGGGNYFVNYLSEPFWFENTASNANRGMEFTISGVAMGHAANGFPTNQVRIRLLENYGGVAHDFQWSPGGSNLTLDQTSGKRIYIYLHKWGGV